MLVTIIQWPISVNALVKFWWFAEKLKMQNLVLWARQHGATVHPNIDIIFHDDYQGYGGVATKDITPEQSDLLISIPLQLALNSRVGFLTEFGKQVLQHVKQNAGLLQKLAALADDGAGATSNNFDLNALFFYLFILYEDAKSDSFWRIYLDALPRNFRTAPFFAPDELNELLGTNLHSTTL